MKLRPVYLSALLTIVGFNAFAAPIPNGTASSVKAVWKPSKSIPCPIVCKEAQSGIAEHDAFTIATLSNKLTYVCKGKTSATGGHPGSGVLFGNNFDSPSRRTLCMVSTADGSVTRLTKFFCLCVE